HTRSKRDWSSDVCSSDLSGLIAQHVDAYGWLRARGYRAEALTPKDLVDRLQVIVMRWPREQIKQLARPKAVPEIGDILGFSPSRSEERRVGKEGRRAWVR